MRKIKREKKRNPSRRKKEKKKTIEKEKEERKVDFKNGQTKK